MKIQKKKLLSIVLVIATCRSCICKGKLNEGHFPSVYSEQHLHAVQKPSYWKSAYRCNVISPPSQTYSDRKFSFLLCKIALELIFFFFFSK